MDPRFRIALSFFLAGSLSCVGTQGSFARDKDSIRAFQGRSDLEQRIARRLFNTAKTANKVFVRREQLLPSAETQSERKTSPNRVFHRADSAALFPGGRQRSVQVSAIDGAIRESNGVRLDLGSEDRNIFLGKNLFANSDTVEIVVEGKIKTLSSGSQVSAAEYIAVKQVVASGNQDIILDQKGRAVGGDVDLSELANNSGNIRASSFTIPENVTTYGDFSKQTDFHVQDALTNFGTVRTTSSSGVSRGSISAAEIVNGFSGLIESSGDLELKADNRLVNFGIIQSTQGLSVSSAEIRNQGVIVANKQLTVVSPKLANSGIIRSETSNILLEAPFASPLYVENKHGSIVAQNGAISLRNTDFGGSEYSQIVGGNLVSQAVYLNSGSGSADLQVERLTGVVEAKGQEAHVLAQTEELRIGSFCLSGDPTIFNTQGSINIVGNIDVAEDLTIIAGQNIFSDYDNDGVLDRVDIHAGDSNRGYDITFIAGAKIDVISGTETSTVGPIPPPHPNVGSVSLSGKASKTGGSIQIGDYDFNLGTVSARSTDSFGDDPGGDISMFAFSGKGGHFLGTLPGSIVVTRCSLETGGKNGGTNGHVTLVGDPASFRGNPGTGTVQGSYIDTTGGTGSGGDLLVATAAPVISIKKDKIIYAANGSRTSASELIASEDLTPLKNGADIQFYHFSSLTQEDTVRVAGRTNIRASSEVQIDTGITSSGPISIETERYCVVDVNRATPMSAPLITLSGGDFFGFDGSGGPPTVPIVVATQGLSINARTALIENDPSITHLTLVPTPVMPKDIVLKVSGTLTVPKQLEARNRIELEADSFDIAGNLVAENEVLLINSGAAPITNAEVRGQIEARRFGARGDIGVDSNNPFVLNNSDSVHEVYSDSGKFFVTNPTAEEIRIKSIDATTTDHMFFRTKGDLTVESIVADSGSIDIGTSASKSASVRIEEGAILNARDTISITNEMPTATSKSSIIIGASVKLLTTTPSKVNPTDGDISVRLGNPSAIDQTSPIFVTVSTQDGGQVKFQGQNPITAQAPRSFVNALGADVVLTNSGTSSKSFVIEGDVEITADPLNQ